MSIVICNRECPHHNFKLSLHIPSVAELQGMPAMPRHTLFFRCNSKYIYVYLIKKKKKTHPWCECQGQATGRPRRGSASVTLRPTRPMQPDAQTTTLTGLRSQYRSAQRICSTSTIPSFALLVPVRGYAVTASRRRTHATELPIAVADAWVADRRRPTSTPYGPMPYGSTYTQYANTDQIRSELFSWSRLVWFRLQVRFVFFGFLKIYLYINC